MFWARFSASDNFMIPSCSLVEARMTRTSRARIRPFTRICCCRIKYSPAGAERVRTTPWFCYRNSSSRSPQMEARGALVNLPACEQREDRSVAWPEPRGKLYPTTRIAARCFSAFMAMAAPPRNEPCVLRSRRYRRAWRPLSRSAARLWRIRKKLRGRRLANQSRRSAVA